MISGAELFCRYAYPPNLLGYCGPDDHKLVAAVATGGEIDHAEITRLATRFEGAWPYLELIGRELGRPPLNRSVVETYWIGSPVIGQVDTHNWGTSVADRFRKRSGGGWAHASNAVSAGGSPSHAFHVFCVYPWVGLLRGGRVGPALEVLDRCRISSGVVEAVLPGSALVRRSPLEWQNGELVAGTSKVEDFYVHAGTRLDRGDIVSLHWRFVCDRLDRRRMDYLERVNDFHMAVANSELRVARLEPAG